MGEAKRKAKLAVQEAEKALGVETPGGRIQVRWDGESDATPFGQMTFFIELLMLTGLYAKWIETCPLSYQGPHSSKTADILGTLFLSALSGHKRFVIDQIVEDVLEGAGYPRAAVPAWADTLANRYCAPG